MTGSWKLVPVKADEAMTRAALGWKGVQSAWRDQLQAAPAPPDDVLERMARAFLEEYDTYRPGRPEAGRQRDAMRSALSAAGED